MSGPAKKDQMHPEDMRNLIIFCVLSLLVYLAYDTFILKPQTDALQKAKLEQATVVETQTSEESTKKGFKPISRDEALKTASRLKIDTGEVMGSIMLKGARLDDLSLKEYHETQEKEQNVTLLSPAGTEHSRYVELGWVSADEAVKVPDVNSVWQIKGNNQLGVNSPVTLVWNNGQGVEFERTYSIDEHYMLTVSQKVINRSGREVTLHPYSLIAQRGLSLSGLQSWLQHEGPIGYIGDELHEISYSNIRKKGQKAYTSNDGWIGINDKYWLTAVIPQQGQETNYRFSRSGDIPGKKETDHGLYQMDYTGAPLILAPGKEASTESRIFVGAKKVLQLEDYESKYDIPKFNLAVNFGWFWFLSKPFFYALHFLNQHLGNMGFAIILLTLVIRSSVFPLTNTSYKSFAKMKKVSPQIAELRKTYADDKAKLQEALVELYGKEGVNPMAGCLPMILQIPIFFALYKVLFVTIEIRHAPFIGWIQDLSAPDPTNIFNLFGLIPWDPPSIMHIGAWPCFMLVGMIIQKKLNPPPQDPLQRDMATYFPFFMTYILSKFPSGLVVYWTVSAFVGIAQQIIIMRAMNVPIYLFGQSESEEEIEKSVDEGGPVVHPLVEMAEHDVEEAMFGDHDEEHDDENPPKVITPPKKKKSGGRKKKKK